MLGVELGSPSALTREHISNLARLKIDLPPHMQVCQNQVRRRLNI